MRSARIIILIILLFYSFSWAKDIILFRWLDDSGKVHYAENYNMIPDTYKARAIQGIFRFQEKNDAQIDKNEPKITNKIEILEDNYREEGGTLKITGRLRNGYPTIARKITIKIKFFDSESKFLFSETTLANPLEVQPGQEATYSLEVQMQPEIATYKTEITWK